MFDVTVRAHFDSAHYLRGYRGRCEELHGHRWQVEATVRCNGLDSIGLSLDFKALKSALGAIIDELDHHCLNELPPFREVNPSSELIAQHIFRQLAGRLESAPGSLYSVRVYESPDTWVTYTKEE